MAIMDRRCPICEGEMHGCSFTCNECWRSLSFTEREAYMSGNPPQIRKPENKFSKATYDMVADVLSTVKRDHYEFGAQKALFDKMVSTFMERFNADNRRFSASAFADAAFRDAGPPRSIGAMDQEWVATPPPVQVDIMYQEVAQVAAEQYRTMVQRPAPQHLEPPVDRMYRMLSAGAPPPVRMTRSGAPTPTAAQQAAAQQDEQE